MIDRWSSDAHNGLKRMLRLQFFKHILDIQSKVSRLDPSQRNHPNKAQTRVNVGGNLPQWVRLPAFSIFS
eukprot:5751941-Ditylum_brightwellii.AAC.1